MADFDLKVKSTGDWAKVHERLSTLQRGQRVWEKVVEGEAKYAANLIRKNLATRGKLTGTTWPRLKRLTWKAKKSKRVLFETGRMAGAITHERVGTGWFIGIVSNAKVPGTSITVRDQATIHEFGTVIIQRWTAKQRRAFFALLRKWGEARRGGSKRKLSKKARAAKAAARESSLKEALDSYERRGKPIPSAGKDIVVVIKIPARPFVFPVLERCYVNARDEVEARILEKLKAALR